MDSDEKIGDKSPKLIQFPNRHTTVSVPHVVSESINEAGEYQPLPYIVNLLRRGYREAVLYQHGVDKRNANALSAARKTED